MQQKGNRDMQNNKHKFIIGIIVAVLVAVIIGLTVSIRSSAPKDDGLIIETGDKEIVIAYDKLNKEQFTGEIVNGKGEVSNSKYSGIELNELLEDNSIEITADSHVSAVSEDNYEAELTGDEILTDGKIYIAILADDEMIESIDGKQGAQLIVYGDANAKRQVRYLKTIIIQ